MERKKYQDGQRFYPQIFPNRHRAPAKFLSMLPPVAFAGVTSTATMAHPAVASPLLSWGTKLREESLPWALE